MYPASAYPALPPPVKVHLIVTPEHECPYLPDRLSTSRAFLAEELPAEVYQAFMDAGFRRSGRMIYQPVCRGCRACVPIRVPVDQFEPSKSQRRCQRRNRDLIVDIAPPQSTAEKLALYQRYL